MNEYKKKIAEDKFRHTNSIWNKLGLNQTNKIGTISKLIQDHAFKTKEDWANYYFQSGAERKKFISLYGEKPGFDRNYGRTKTELNVLALELYKGVLEKGERTDITLEECEECVFYRVIGETWNGIMVREEETINNLKRIFSALFKGTKDFSFKKTGGDEDARYAVDFEVFDGEKLILGLQIKPDSYKTASKDVLGNIHELNIKKNLMYKRDKGADVTYVYSDLRGAMSNQGDVIKALLASSQVSRMKVVSE